MLLGFLTIVIMAGVAYAYWHQCLMGFDPDYDAKSSTRVIRAVLPPDRVWLAMMQRAGAYSFSNPFTSPDSGVKQPQTQYDWHVTFDKYSTFELRYKRHRRY